MRTTGPIGGPPQAQTILLGPCACLAAVSSDPRRLAEHLQRHVGAEGYWSRSGRRRLRPSGCDLLRDPCTGVRDRRLCFAGAKFFPSPPGAQLCCYHLALLDYANRNSVGALLLASLEVRLAAHPPVKRLATNALSSRSSPYGTMILLPSAAPTTGFSGKFANRKSRNARDFGLPEVFPSARRRVNTSAFSTSPSFSVE